MKHFYLISLFALTVCVPQLAFAELEALFFSGQPGVFIDANGDGVLDGGNEGMVTAMYDPDSDVMVIQADASIGGGIVIYQITQRFGTQVLQEIAQFPVEGEPQFINSRPSDQFITFFLDTVDFTPIDTAARALLQRIMGGGK